VVRGFVDGYYTDVLDTRVPVGAGTARPPDLPGLGVALRPGFRDRADVTVRASGDRTAAAAPAGRAALS
jgi:hypothetical protein